MKHDAMSGTICDECGHPNCDGIHYARPVAALVVAFVAMALSGLLLVAQGSPGWRQDRPTAFTSLTVSTAAQTVAVSMPEVAR